ncbi:MAG TPA: hypothetical protein G4N96_06235 [Chloroflexi bacterium]|nr:hypothetical protein [Chloroflexota bacterium]
MRNINPRLKISLIAAPGFGPNFVVGNILSKLLLRNGALVPARDLFLAKRLAIGLALFI